LLGDGDVLCDLLGDGDGDFEWCGQDGEGLGRVCPDQAGRTPGPMAMRTRPAPMSRTNRINSRDMKASRGLERVGLDAGARES
jgi:hypothetical protein